MNGAKEKGVRELENFAIEIIQGAGKEALALYGKGATRMKFDEGLVTEAELRLNDYFQNHIQAEFPEHRIFRNNQEHEGYSHEGKRYLWVYDPLDGVANFQAGIPIWGLSLALLENFWPIFGVFHMPVTGDLFHAQAGKKAFHAEEEIRVSLQEELDDESLLLIPSRFHHHFRSTFPGKMRVLGSNSAHLCYVAMGRAEAAVLSNESYQDLAAARVIVEAAGAKIYRLDGKEFFLNEYLNGERITDHLVVSSPNAFPQVRKCLHRIS